MKRTLSIIVMIIISLTMLTTGCSKKDNLKINPSDLGNDKQIYEKGFKLIKKNPEKARLLFKELIQIYPNSVYARKAKIGIADSYFKEKDTSSLIIASSEYQEFVNLYPNSPDAVYAKYQIGRCYYQQMRKPGRDQTNTYKTITAFENLIKQFPGTKEAEDAKKIIKTARSYLALHYFRIGMSNYHLDAFKGAIDRFKHVINNFPDFEKIDKLMFFTGKCYMAVREYDTAISFFQRIINGYSKSRYAKKSIKKIKEITELKSQQKNLAKKKKK